MSLSTATPHGTFASLRVPAFRSFFLGQTVSLPGTWMQTVAQGWLVIELTGSGTVLGTVVAVQFVQPTATNLVTQYTWRPVEEPSSPRPTHCSVWTAPYAPSKPRLDDSCTGVERITRRS
jgi:hypothetical protein